MSRPRPTTVPVRLGDRLELEVQALGSDGDGIARLDGYVVLVPGVLAGERALVEITSAARKFGRAQLVRVLRPVAGRVQPACRHFLACGGCDLQHLDYPLQLQHKQQQLQRLLDARLGAGAPRVQPLLRPEQPYGARHKVVVHLRRPQATLQAGFHRARSLELVPVTECPASAPRALQLAFATVQALSPLPLPVWDAEYPGGLLRSVLVRAAAGTDAMLVVVVAAGPLPELRQLAPALHRAGATTIAANLNQGPAAQLLGRDTTVVAGPPRLHERLGGIDYLVAPSSFFQTSPHGAVAAIGLVLDALAPGPDDVVGDLFCGGGLFTLPLARRARSVTGIELAWSAVQDAEQSARHNGITNARFVHGPVAAKLEQLRRDGWRPHQLVLDPPRQGCGAELVATVAGLRPARIAYVSCDPQALATDLQAFVRHGYRAVSAQPVDMFPHTGHLETLVALQPAR